MHGRGRGANSRSSSKGRESNADEGDQEDRADADEREVLLTGVRDAEATVKALKMKKGQKKAARCKRRQPCY